MSSRPLLLRLFHRWPYSVPACLWFDCQLLFGTSTCVLLESLVTSLRHSDRCTHLVLWSNCLYIYILLFSVFRGHETKMIRLRLHTCVLLASLSSAHHWSEHKGLGRALSFLSHDFVHLCIAGPDSPSPCSSSLSVDSSSELVLVDGLSELVEVVLVDGPCELDVDRICPFSLLFWHLIGEAAQVLETQLLKKFQAHFECTSSSSSESMGLCFFAFGKSLGFFTSAVVVFPFCLLGLSFLGGDLEQSLTRVPRLLTPHRQMEVHVQVLAHAIYTFVVFRSYQDPHQVQWLLDNHWLNWWYRRRLWRLCVRMYSITRSGPLPLSPILW